MTDLQRLLDSEPTREQRECKYLLDASGARKLLEVVATRLQLLVRREVSQDSYVRTTYYDTPDAAHYRSSFGPVSRRVRVREYATLEKVGGELRPADVCYLELKQSAAGRRSKVRVPLRAGEVGARISNLADMSLAPCMSTWYRRVAFGDEDERVRVTLDDRLVFCEPVAIGSPFGSEPRQVLASGPPFVLEVKLWGEAPWWLERTLSSLPEEVGFSKFLIGMRAARECGSASQASESVG